MDCVLIKTNQHAKYNKRAQSALGRSPEEKVKGPGCPADHGKKLGIN